MHCAGQLLTHTHAAFLVGSTLQILNYDYNYDYHHQCEQTKTFIKLCDKVLHAAYGFNDQNVRNNDYPLCLHYGTHETSQTNLLMLAHS